MRKMRLRILADLELEAALLRVKREVLKALLDRGKISTDTFNLLNQRISEIEGAMVNLRNMIDGERKFWESVSSEGSKILESLLVDFRLLNLVGDIGDEEWLRVSKIIEMGLHPTKSQGRLSITKSKNSISAGANTQNRRGHNNATRRDRQAMHQDEHGLVSMSDSHCMNPWKPSCRRTDIKLSIYYNGQFLPICHECWKEISEKNIEWTR
ncbi:MAG: hypothetical protein QXR59_02960 [Candidatus Bathyarchaeia archaeon]